MYQQAHFLFSLIQSFPLTLFLAVESCLTTVFIFSTFVVFISAYNLNQVRHEEQSQKRKRNQEDLGKRKKFKADRKAGAKDNTMNIEPLTIEVCG